MRPVVIAEEATLAAAPEEVWPLITDTDRTNRLVFGQPVVFRPIEQGARTSARFVGAAKAAGLTLEYEEAPFEWTVNESFSVCRRMRSGPLTSYTFGIAIEPGPGGGTRVSVRLELVPRHWIYLPVVHIEARRVVSRMVRLAAQIDAHLSERAESPFVVPRSSVNEARLEPAAKELAGLALEPAVVSALFEHVRKAPDADLVRMRPLELAESCGVDGREMLRALLHGVTVGLVELRWALVCPSCRTANDQVASLSAITGASHCQLCDITYDVELDRVVEATFRVHPSVREVHDQMFCIGGPRRTPHVLVQTNVDAGGARSVEVPGAPGRYRVFARGGAVASLEVGSEGPAEARVGLTTAGLSPNELTLGPSGILTIENGTEASLHVKIERPGYASLAATAHMVTTMAEFRRLFSKELLKPSTPLKVASCAILFSDLTGSTALYTSAGDAAAFRLVDDHFDLLRTSIAEAGGTVVKTMGDAVMAAFLEPSSCVRAAAACLRAFEKFRARHEHGAQIGLKLGLFAGPCYVVNANLAIDYFGQTVNCAARVQHLAGSGELMLEERLYESLPEACRAELEVIEAMDVHVKGVDAALRLVRTRLAASAAPGAVAAAS
jgi:adenylate cyclase